MNAAALLSVEDLRVSYRRGGEVLEAVRGVSLAIAPGECVGVVGESGSGKTQLCLAIMGLLPPEATIGGTVRFAGGGADPGPSAWVDAIRAARGSRLAMVFQDPQSALTPHLRSGVQMAEVLVRHRGSPWPAARAAAREMLGRIGIADPDRCLERYPH